MDLSALMQLGTESGESAEQRLPLALPEEIWVELDAEKQKTYRLSQRILDDLSINSEPVLLQDVADSAKATLGEFLEALHVLSSMDLVGIDFGDFGPELNLLAVPDEHIKIRGLDGRFRWVFVARPLDPPAHDYSELN